ncbi:MAG: DUF1501 domain-containing protein [Bacteroidota bacterium]
MIDRITRRKFLKGASATLLPIALSGFQLRAFGRTPLLDAIGRQFQSTGRSLVIIQLGGGNDGLNMLVPYGMSQYYNSRPTIAIPSNDVLQIGSTAMGLNPSLAPLLNLYNNAKVSIVQGVGYANPNRSHFRSTDIWLTGTSSDVVESTGWLGRDLNYNHPDYPDVLTPSPLALQVGGSPSLSLMSVKGDMGVTITDPDQFYQLITGTVGFVDDPPPKTPAGKELRYLRTIAQEAIQYATVIKAAADLSTNQATYPDTSLAAQLAIVARLIAGGLKCPIYMVSQGGYDTHSSQNSRQAALYSDLSGSIAAFQLDVELLGVGDNVIGMTFSEFGRRIAENGSSGTDHGTSSPQILFGTKVLGGLHGPNPDFNNVDSVGDFIHNIDFRQLYATILGSWFGASTEELEAVLFGQFTQLPIIQSSRNAALRRDFLPTRYALNQNYPNPFNPSTTLSYDVPEDSFISLVVYNEAGQKIREVFRGVRQQGRYSQSFEGNDLASGVYFLRMEAGKFVDTRKMVLVR